MSRNSLALTPEQVAQIRELRTDGLTCREVAGIVGCDRVTVQKYAPGRPGKVPVAPLREAFLASGHTAADVARELGWWTHGIGDGSRVRRTLGLVPTTNGAGRRSYRTFVDAETVERIADALGLMAWEVMPQDEEDAA